MRSTDVKRYRLLGKPVAHSLSPLLYDVAFSDMGIDATYSAVEIEPQQVPDMITETARSGGGNVTLPYKLEAARCIARPSADVEATGACNCFWQDANGAVAGDNTDIEGFRRAAAEIPDLLLRNADILIVGAGGAAAAVLQACVMAGATRVHLVNRSSGRARALVRRFEKTSTEVRVVPRGDLYGSMYDLVVNATSLGMALGDPLPIDLAVIEVRAAMDLVYGPGGTPWTRSARTEGIHAVDGLSMLVHQAAISVKNWFGSEPPVEPMLSAARLKLAWNR